MVSGSVRAGRLLQKCTDRCCISRTGGKKVHNPNAFVMEYEEHMDDETGVGTFYLHIKQKRTRMMR